jgi:5-formyltetrahydrofolate cyclo-ligase
VPVVGFDALRHRIGYGGGYMTLHWIRRIA